MTAQKNSNPRPRPRHGKGGRWLYCPREIECLEFAIKKKWTAFNCETCLLWPDRPPARRPRKRKTGSCPECGRPKAIYAKGVCRSCYQREYQRTRKCKTGTCLDCGGEKGIYAKGLCRACYQRAGYLKRKAAGEKGKTNDVGL